VKVYDGQYYSCCHRSLMQFEIVRLVGDFGLRFHVKLLSAAKIDGNKWRAGILNFGAKPNLPSFITSTHSSAFISITRPSDPVRASNL